MALEIVKILIGKENYILGKQFVTQGQSVGLLRDVPIGDHEEINSLSFYRQQEGGWLGRMCGAIGMGSNRILDVVLITTLHCCRVYRNNFNWDV